MHLPPISLQSFTCKFSSRPFVSASDNFPNSSTYRATWRLGDGTIYVELTTGLLFVLVTDNMYSWFCVGLSLHALMGV